MYKYLFIISLLLHTSCGKSTPKVDAYKHSFSILIFAENDINPSYVFEFDKGVLVAIEQAPSTLNAINSSKYTFKDNEMTKISETLSELEHLKGKIQGEGGTGAWKLKFILDKQLFFTQHDVSFTNLPSKIEFLLSLMILKSTIEVQFSGKA